MKSPFKFLDSYTKDDREIFFGRDSEIEELYQKVFDSKLLLVYGVSGTGKSSLIHCGLANKFHDTDWLPLIVRRGSNIIESMAASVKAASITPQQNNFLSQADFRKGVRSLYLDHYKPVFFIFDQFEELFIFADREERKSFIQIIKSLVESDLQCRMIFVMREEYMAGVTEFEKLIPTFFSNRVRIEKMSHLNALEAIKKPCKVFNINLDEGFAETLLEKLSPGSTEIELTYLQVFLDKIFRTAVNEKGSDQDNKCILFSNSLLNRVGDVSDLLGSFLDEQISLMENPEIALRILKSLVSEQGTKRHIAPDEIANIALTFGEKIEMAEMNKILQTFINLRILRDKDENEKVELRHDALAVKIFEKFTIAEKELLEVRKFIENAFYTFEKRGILLDKQGLEYLVTYEKNLILPQNLADFIIQSKDKLKVRQKSLIRITRVSTLIFVLILAVALRFYLKTQKDTALNDMFRLAVIESEINPAKGLISKLQIWEKDSLSSELHNMILSDFQKLLSLQVDASDSISLLQDYLKPVEMESEIMQAEISSEGNYVFGWLVNQKVFVYNIITNKINCFRIEGDPALIKISEKDSLLAIVSKNNSGVVCDFSGNKHYTFQTSLNNVFNNQIFCFFPSGKYQLLAAKDNDAMVFDNTGKSVFSLKAHSGNINSIDITPNGQFVVTASSDKRSLIWNYNQITKQFSVYDSLIGHTDTIWSCRFNKTGKYVITASKDSTIKIWNLNGKQINPEFLFAINIFKGNRVKYNNQEHDEDATNPAFSKYYSKFLDASFSPGEKEIIATGYSENSDSHNQRMLESHKVLFFDRKSAFTKIYDRPFFFGGIQIDTIMPVIFSDIIVSSNEKVAAATDPFSKRIYLLAGDGRKLLTLSGSNILFSHDGQQLFWVLGNKINRIPISPYEIKRLIEKFNIKGQSETKSENFVVI